MNRISSTVFGLCLGAQVFVSCSSDKKSENQTDSGTTVTTENPAAPTEKTENAPAGYKVIATPDSAVLGKEKEALVKVTGINVVELSDADGKSTGSELTLDLTLTNKSTLENKKFFSVSSSDARLELDNKTLIPAGNSNGDSSPEPEASSTAVWKFTLPPNTKPVKLNFFLDGTRVSVNLAAQ
jgi:hypothetical protein